MCEVRVETEEWASKEGLLQEALLSSHLDQFSAHKQKHALVLPVLLRSWGRVTRNETEPFSFVLDIFIYNSRMSSESTEVMNNPANAGILSVLNGYVDIVITDVVPEFVYCL